VTVFDGDLIIMECVSVRNHNRLSTKQQLYPAVHAMVNS